MAAVRLGNDGALDRGEPLEGKLITTIQFPDNWTTQECVKGLSDRERGAWIAHSRLDVPVWVESDNPDLEEAIAEHYGDIPIGRTEGEWK